MRSKKGYFFILDAVIGVLIMTIAYVSFVSEPVFVPQKSRLDIIASDVQSFLNNIRIEDLDDSEIQVIQDLLADGQISSKRNTLAQQIGEFYYKGELGDASQFGYAEDLIGVIGDVVPSQFNLEVVIVNGEENVLYQRFTSAKENSRIIIVKKSIVFGMDNVAVTLWGPYTMEVKMWE